MFKHQALLDSNDESLLVFVADRSKSWVDIGGNKALMAFSGAPHKPGTIYILNEKTIIARNNRDTEI